MLVRVRGSDPLASGSSCGQPLIGACHDDEVKGVVSEEDPQSEQIIARLAALVVGNARLVCWAGFRTRPSWEHCCIDAKEALAMAQSSKAIHIIPVEKYHNRAFRPAAGLLTGQMGPSQVGPIAQCNCEVVIGSPKDFLVS